MDNGDPHAKAQDARGGSDDLGQQIQERQLELIAAAHPGIAVTDQTGTRARRPGEPFGVLFRDLELLVRPDALPAVTKFIAGTGLSLQRPQPGALLDWGRPGASRRSATALGKGGDIDLDHAQEMAAHLPVRLVIPDAAPVSGIPDLCRQIGAAIGPDQEGFPPVSPRHVFYFTPNRILCPATEPGQVSRDDDVYPPMRPTESGCGTSVAVLDTGFIRAASGHFFWLEGITDFDPDPLDHFNLAAQTDTPDGFIDPYSGHGTFIAGIIRRIAPAADVHVRRLDIDLRDIFTQPSYAADVIDEMHIPDHVRRALWNGHRVVSLSAGGYTLDGLPPLSFRGLKALLDRQQAMLVAAAGNDGSTDPFWPAAFDWTVGVGALDATGNALAAYSNTGLNANVFARGSDIVNAYACGDYTCFQPPDEGTVRHFHGLAKWSGTSFATPIVAGLIAARMSANGESAPAAWAALQTLAQGPHAIAGVGPTLATEYTDLGI
jgi:hypothetical protein